MNYYHDLKWVAYDIEKELEELKNKLRISPNQVSQVQAENQAIEKLESLIGLNQLKSEIKKLVSFLKIQQQREELGLPKVPITNHLVFCGSPGTGKTTVARLIGKIYQELGILKKGHCIETDRSGMVAEYVGQTAPKTDKLVD